MQTKSSTGEASFGSPMDTWKQLFDEDKTIVGEPWSLFWKEMKYGTEEFKRLMEDPLSELIGKIEGVDLDWKVYTTIVGHEKVSKEYNEDGSRNGNQCPVLRVSPDDKVVHLTLIRH